MIQPTKRHVRNHPRTEWKPFCLRYYAGAGDIDGSRANAARSVLLASEEHSEEPYRRSLLVSEYIEMFAHNHDNARGFLHSALIATDAENWGITAIVH